MDGSFAFVFAEVVVPWLVGRDADDGWRHAWFFFGVLAISMGTISLVFLRDQPKVDPEGQAQAARDADRSAGQGRGSWPMAAYKNPMIWLVTFLAFNSG